MGIALLLFTIGCFLRSLIGYALFFTVLVVALGAVGQIAIKNGEMTAGKTNPSKVKAGPWLDPYGLAQAPAPEDGKKTYYLVDSERNAIVDVLRLGKRAEAQLLRRAARQSCKIRG